MPDSYGRGTGADHPFGQATAGAGTSAHPRHPVRPVAGRDPFRHLPCLRIDDGDVVVAVDGDESDAAVRRDQDPFGFLPSGTRFTTVCASPRRERPVRPRRDPTRARIAVGRELDPVRSLRADIESASTFFVATSMIDTPPSRECAAPHLLAVRRRDRCLRVPCRRGIDGLRAMCRRRRATIADTLSTPIFDVKIVRRLRRQSPCAWRPARSRTAQSILSAAGS